MTVQTKSVLKREAIVKYRHTAKLPRNKNTTDKLLQVPSVSQCYNRTLPKFANTLKKMNAYGSKYLDDFAVIN